MIVMGKETFLAPEIMFQVKKRFYMSAPVEKDSMPATIFFN